MDHRFVLRRKLLKAVPFIYCGRAFCYERETQSASSSPNGGEGSSGTDATAAVLASLLLSQWSSDLIASGNHVSELAAKGDFGGNMPISDTTGIFAYSSGAYMSGLKR